MTNDLIPIILIIVSCILLSSVLDRIAPRISVSLFQVTLGIIVSFVFDIKLSIFSSTDVFMVFFVGPILYKEAREANVSSLIKNKFSILSLAIGLVFVLTLCIGFTINSLIPTVPLWFALALGAALGPTDVVSVTSLPQGVKLPRRISDILKGECLINDATGIVCFEFSLIGASVGTISASGAVIEFIYLFFGGFLVGIVIGLLFNLISKILETYRLTTASFSILLDVSMPFFVYSIAASLQVSSLIAVVATSIVIPFSKSEVNPYSSKLSITNKSVWEFLSFILNGAIFVMLGITIPAALSSSWNSDQVANYDLVLYVFVVFLILFAIRFVWCFFLDFKIKKENMNRCYLKKHMLKALLLTIGGAKGAITLSIIFTIPTIYGAQAFIARDIIIFVAGVVVVLTLLLSNFLLPVLALKCRQDEHELFDIKTANQELVKILRKVVVALANQETASNKQATREVISDYTIRINNIKDYLNIEEEMHIEVRLYCLNIETAYVLKLVKEEKVDRKVANQYLDYISQQQNLLTQKNQNTYKLKMMWIIVLQRIKNVPIKIKNAIKKNNVKHWEGTIKDYINTGYHHDINNIGDLEIASISYIIEVLNDKLSDSEQITSNIKTVNRNWAYRLNDSVPHESHDINSANMKKTFDDSNLKVEHISTVLMQYRRKLDALRSKFRSVETIERLNSNKYDIESKGLEFEMHYLNKAYNDKEINEEIYDYLKDRINLMIISREIF